MLKDFHDNSKVWVYVANRLFSVDEIEKLYGIGATFARQWAAHGKNLKSTFEILHDQVLVLAVDGSEGNASGCSIDTSVRFIRQLETEFDVVLLDRKIFLYRDGVNGMIRTGHLDKWKSLEKNENTLVFDHLVQDKKSLDAAWEPLNESWISNF